MSFFDDASLAFLPSGAAGKDGKAYSIKPTDGTGDFTFSRGSNLTATRVNASGLIEKGRENLLLQSNNFDTSWGASATITSGESGYDGSSDAWLMTTAVAGDFVAQSLSDDGVLTFSIYAKAGSVNGIRLRMDAAVDANAYFDLTNGGSIYATSGDIDSKLVSVGNGWYRVSVTANISSVVKMAIYTTDGTTSYDNGTIYIQDAQLEIGLAATDYIESGATTGKAGLLENEPRFDYSGGATCPSLLLEPSRTQLIEQSEYYEGSDWSSKETLETLEDVTNPEGTNTTYKVCATASNINHYFERASWTGAISGVDYVFSFFAKAQDSNFVQVATSTGFVAKYQNFNLSNGTLGNGDANAYGYTSTIEPVGTNGWYRISVKATTTTTDARFLIIPVLSDVSARNPVFLGNGSSGFYMWGAQLEQASYPTSYIPNHSGGSVTRGADFCDGAGDTTSINSTEGVLFVEIKTTHHEDTAISLSDGGPTNRIFISFDPNDSNQYRAYSTGGANLYYYGTDQSVFTKAAIRYSLNNFSLWVDGQKRAETLSYAGISANALNELAFDRNGLGELKFFGNAKQVLYFPTALSDADMITLTT